MQENLTLRNIPQELKLNGLWCGWRLTQKGKEPFELSTGAHAKSNDESTFSTYAVLLNNVHKYLAFENGKQVGGIGLGIFRGYSAIDIDHCVDGNGNLSEMARDIVSFCDSYTEYSPSGTGIRVIFKTNRKIDKSVYYINNRNNGLEIYISGNTNKFVSITGNKISGDEIREVDIGYILDKYMKKGAFGLEKALKKDQKLAQLWNKQAPGSGADESETDMALACKLAFYLNNDPEAIKEAIERSPYFASKDAAHLRKWASGYGTDTVKAAIAFQRSAQPIAPRPSGKAYDQNDTGNAHRFADMFGQDLRYAFENKTWMKWNGKFWQADPFGDVKNLAEIMAESMSMEVAAVQDMAARIRAVKNLEHVYSSAGKEAMLKEARHLSGIPAANSEFDRDPYLLCTGSGVYDFRTGETRDFAREDMISMTTGCEIGKSSGEFGRFAKEIFADPEVERYVQKAIGYSATNSTREQCMFILHGDGNNGKSLFLEVIAAALGSYAITSKPQLLTDNKFQTTNSEEIARLNGKRFCAVEEIKEGERMDEQIVKQLTSGIGKMVARFLYAGSFEFNVTCKIWMSTNYEFVIRGTDKGIWRRIVKIPVPTDFTGREDKDLKERLLSDLPSALAWILEGYRMYKEEGLEKPAAVERATAEYRKEMDIVQQWVEEYCETGASYFERANALYDNFRAFCMRRDQRTNQTIFGRNLGKKFKKYNSGEGIVYIGIRLKAGAGDIAKKVAYEQAKVDDDI